MPSQTKPFPPLFLSGALMALSLLLAATPAEAGDEAGAEAGILTCTTLPDSRVNLVIHSAADVECEYTESDGTVEHYTGSTGVGLGGDLHISHEETLVFTVLAKHREANSHQLTGWDHGAKAGVTAGHGAGAALLIGGSEDSIGLKPAVSHSRGVGLAAGIGYLYLEPREQPLETTQR